METRILIASIAFVLLLSLGACSSLEALDIGAGEVAESSEPAINSTNEGEVPLANSGPAPAKDAPDDQAPIAEPPTQGPAASTAAQPTASSGTASYVIVDTGQNQCYDNNSEIACPQSGEAFYGQDAQYASVSPRYQDNGNGTVTDLNTGLMWQQDPGEKMNFDQATAGASSFDLAGYSDWRLPIINELYSLIDFSGLDVSRCVDLGSCAAIPFIDTDYFDFEYGDTAAGERTIDSQWATSSLYVSDVMNGQQAMFGVNFADGRIKGYGTGSMGRGKAFFVIYVRGNNSYGINSFVDNGNGAVSDQATGLTWTQSDSGTGLDWEGALNYCENLDYAGCDDWRLPNAKELHSIVDYSRSPDTSNSAAIDPVFDTSSITNEAGQLDFPAFWSSTTHATAEGSADSAVYITFGEALGNMNGSWMDVHGAGAQRADMKSGDPSQLPIARGPQGDAMRVYNYVRCVRDGAQYVQVTNSGSGGTAGQAPAGNQPPSGDQSGASNAGQPPMGGQPPAEAINACSGLSENASCQFNAPHGAITGTCAVIGDQLACAPAGGPPSESP